MAYIEVAPEAIKAALEGAGFAQAEHRGEIVFERAHVKDARLVVRVYTSISSGGRTRGCGSDAIRATLLYRNGTTRGVMSSKRVHRTGTVQGVCERMIDRAREMYQAAIDMRKVGSCSCGAPRYADSRRCVAKCWEGGKR